MKLNTKQVKKIDVHLKNVKGFLTSFFEDDKKFTHVNIAEPFDSSIRSKLIKSAKKLNIPHHTDKTVITIEGLRFSTKAESRL